MAGSGVYVDFEVISAADSTLFQVNPTIEEADFELIIKNAIGTNVSFGPLDILPVVEPASGYTIKVEFSDVEMTAALVRQDPMMKIIAKDATTPTNEWNMLSVTWTGESITNIQMAEIWQRLGLDPDNPLTTHDNNHIEVGAIDIDAVNISSTTVQTRQ